MRFLFVLILVGLSTAVFAGTENLAKYNFVYKTVGDIEIHGSVYPVAGSALKPAVLYLHGGGLVADGLGYFEEWGTHHLRRFHDAGYVVVNIEYRLAPQTKLPEIFSDVESAYAWMRNEGARDFGIDPNRIAVFGHSAGGYLAALSGARLSPRPAAVIMGSGYSDISGDWRAKPDPEYLKKPLVSETDAIASLGDRNGELSSTDSARTDLIFGDRGYWVYLLQNGLFPLEVAGRDALKEPEWFTPWNPVELVTSEYPPTFILHGGKDRGIPVEQPEQMYRALLAERVPTIYIFAADGIHCFDALGVGEEVPDFVPPIMDKMDSFLRTYLKKILN